MATMNKDDGFSLLEVLVALVIASASLIIIIQSYSAGFKNRSKTNLQYEMARLAESKLDEIEVNLRHSPKNEFGVINERYSWAATYEPYTESATRNREAYWVDVSIIYDGSTHQKNTFNLKRLMIVDETVNARE